MKKRLSSAFYSQTDRQTQRQNSILKAYFKAFPNWKQNNGVMLLTITKFAYNNAKNTSTSHILYKCNYEYYPRVLF